MIVEEFRPIKGYEGLYEVSNLGRVRSLKNNHTGETRVLQQCKSSCGYLQVALCKNGKRKMCKVHRLVAEAFIPNPLGLPCVNHIDEDKTNNIETNLEWCSVGYNNAYGTRTERTSKRVYQYTKDGSFVRSYPSLKEAERQTGIHNANISHCCLNRPKRKSIGGYIWSFDPPISSTTRVLF